MNVAFFGGSFDPPHVAHVLGAAYVLAIGAVERVLVVPVFEHAFDKRPVEFRHRVRMCELAMGLLPDVSVDPIEETLGTPSRTLFTLEGLARRHPDWRFRLVIGADVLLETQKWHAFDAIERIAPPLVLGRVGFEHTGTPAAVLPDISSTRVRELLEHRDDSVCAAELERYVPLAVRKYIEQHGLYR
jgi:nicotinate-nucleotide adenylyltransferase